MSRPLKSVHITNYYHKHSGGIGTSFNKLLEAAERHRRFIRLIVPGESEAVEDVNEFAKIYYVPARRSPIIDKRYRLIMPWQYMVKGSVIRRILLEERPDLIEVTDKYTLSILGPMIRTNNFRKLGRPMLIHFSCERLDDNIGSFLATGRFGKWLARCVIGHYTIPGFDFHIANSMYTAAEFFDSVDPKKNRYCIAWLFDLCWKLLKAPRVNLEDRILVCPRGVDAEHFSPQRRSPEVRRELLRLGNASEGSTILLYAGRLSPEKNVGLLIDLMKILAKDEFRDFRLLLAGDGPKRKWLKKQAEEYARGKVAFLGHLEKEKLASYYANADIFVHPNPKEPFGIAPLEAMASGVPTVAPNAGGILSYATTDNAWLVEPSGGAFATAVREIVNNAELRNTKVEKGVAAARQNTSEAATDRLLETYDRIFADFSARNDLYTDIEEPKTFNYWELIKVSMVVACLFLLDI